MGPRKIQGYDMSNCWIAPEYIENEFDFRGIDIGGKHYVVETANVTSDNPEEMNLDDNPVYLVTSYGGIEGDTIIEPVKDTGLAKRVLDSLRFSIVEQELE